jgi:hypothetical protein
MENIMKNKNQQRLEKYVKKLSNDGYYLNDYMYQSYKNWLREEGLQNDRTISREEKIDMFREWRENNE